MALLPVDILPQPFFPYLSANSISSGNRLTGNFQTRRELIPKRTGDPGSHLWWSIGIHERIERRFTGYEKTGIQSISSQLGIYT